MNKKALSLARLLAGEVRCVCCGRKTTLQATLALVNQPPIKGLCGTCLRSLEIEALGFTPVWTP